MSAGKTASTITSGGKRNPENDEGNGETGPRRAGRFTASH